MATSHKKTGKIPAMVCYPGAFCVVPSSVAAMKRLLHDKLNPVTVLPVSIVELPDHYRIEVKAPGYHREDFFITSTRRRLLIVALAKGQTGEGAMREATSQPPSLGVRQGIRLPVDVDPDFAEAGYVDGILHICLYKTMSPGKVGAGQIVVY